VSLRSLPATKKALQIVTPGMVRKSSNVQTQHSSRKRSCPRVCF
jgi:hypothetical protein